MIIPSDPQRKETKIKYLMDTCLSTQESRYQNYDYRRQYFLFGTADDVSSRTLYNRLQAHTDLVASFLYSADHAEFDLSAPPGAIDDVIEQCVAVGEHWNDQFRDSGIAEQVAQALLWALNFDSMFLKIGWNEEREFLTSMIVPPYNFGVYDESEPDLDSQHAFCHTFVIDYDEACQRLHRAGLEHRIQDLRHSTTDSKPSLPEPLSLMLANTQRQHITDPVVGKVIPNYARSFNYIAEPDTSRVRLAEIWVWDNDATEDDEGRRIGDYRRFLMMEPGTLLEDSKELIQIRKKIGLKSSRYRVNEKLMRWTDTNDFLPGEHPFGHIRPYPLFDYFWGECHAERLIPLQDWTTTRLNEIHEIMDMQVDPPRTMSGFMGLTDEKAEAYHGPGAWVTDMNPSAKVEMHYPQMPQDLFAELASIGKLFEEASGLTETLTQGGAPNVRSGKQAKHAAITGSSRIKKTAISLEPQLVNYADVAVKLLQAKDDTELKTAGSGMSFKMSQLATPNWKMRISGHSHSPLFSDESRELAQLLLRAQAIDRSMFMHMLRPPGEANMQHLLKKRMAAEQALIAKNPQLLQGGSSKKKANGIAHATG